MIEGEKRPIRLKIDYSRVRNITAGKLAPSQSTLEYIWNNNLEK